VPSVVGVVQESGEEGVAGMRKGGMSGLISLKTGASAVSNL